MRMLARGFFFSARSCASIEAPAVEDDLRAVAEQ